MKDKTAPEKKPSGLTTHGLYGLNSRNFNNQYSFSSLDLSRSNPSAATTATVTTIFPAGIMTFVVAVAMVIALFAGVASAYPAEYLESGTAWGYTPGDISGLKNEYPADFPYYHISWIKIVPESDTDEWGVESDYICTIKTPHGKEIYIQPGSDVFYTPGKNGGGLFDDGGIGYYSVNISSLVAGAKADMIPWKGTWTIDYFLNQKDSKYPPDYAFVTNTSFTVYDDYTSTPTPTPEMATQKTAVTTPGVPEGFIPAGSYTSDTSGAEPSAGDSGSVNATISEPTAGYTGTDVSPEGGENQNGFYIWLIAAGVIIIAVFIAVRILAGRKRDDYYL